MMFTLHAYVLRELLKTLGLTVIALTALFTMGGGLYNVVRPEGFSSSDVLHFLPLLLPAVATLTLPMAALFAGTMVYGRLAADNELNACRAAGINVHRLFLPIILLSTCVALFSLLFGNFVVPGLVTRIFNVGTRNLHQMVAQHLRQEGYYHWRPGRGRSAGLMPATGADEYTITAERVQDVAEQALQDKGFETGPGLQYLLLTNPTFLQADHDGKLVRFTVARHGLCAFDTREDVLKFTITVHEGRDFQVGKHSGFVGLQEFAFTVPFPSLVRLSLADLRSLVHWREAPWEVPSKLSRDMLGFRAALTQQSFYADCAARLARGQPVRLETERGRTFAVQGGATERSARGLTILDARVEIQRPDEPIPTVYRAPRVELRARPLPSGYVPVEIRLLRSAQQDVVELDPRTGEPLRRPTLSLDGASLSDEFLQTLARYTPAAILDPTVPLPAEDVLGDQRIGLQKGAHEMRLRVGATIHFRLALCASALATALMGAALGALFRGARALAAFALAMIPFFSVGFLMVLGRQLTEEPGTSVLGPFVTWGGLALVLVADLIILRVGVQR